MRYTSNLKVCESPGDFSTEFESRFLHSWFNKKTGWVSPVGHLRFWIHRFPSMTRLQKRLPMRSPSDTKEVLAEELHRIPTKVVSSTFPRGGANLPKKGKRPAELYLRRGREPRGRFDSQQRIYMYVYYMWICIYVFFVLFCLSCHTWHHTNSKIVVRTRREDFWNWETLETKAAVWETWTLPSTKNESYLPAHWSSHKKCPGTRTQSVGYLLTSPAWMKKNRCKPGWFSLRRAK